MEIISTTTETTVHIEQMQVEIGVVEMTTTLGPMLKTITVETMEAVVEMTRPMVMMMVDIVPTITVVTIKKTIIKRTEVSKVNNTLLVRYNDKALALIANNLCDPNEIG